MAEFRWILLGLGLLLIGGIWWWGARRSARAPGNAELRESFARPAELMHTLDSEPRESTSTPWEGGPEPRETAPASASRDWGVSPFEPLSIRTADFESVPTLDGPMMADAAESPPAAPNRSTSILSSRDLPGLTSAAALSSAADLTSAADLSGPADARNSPMFGSPELPGAQESLGAQPSAGAAEMSGDPLFDAREMNDEEQIPGAQLSGAEQGLGTNKLGRNEGRDASRAVAPSVPAPRANTPAMTQSRPAARLAPAAPAGEHSDRFANSSPQAPNAAELQKIVTVRVCAAGDSRWAGTALMAALELNGLAYGRYQVFHRNHVDGRSLFCAASLIEPGTFDLAGMPDAEFRGVTLFAVLPGPVEPLLTVDELLSAARGLAEELSGVVQDAKGYPMSPQRASALRDDTARFQAMLPRT